MVLISIEWHDIFDCYPFLLLGYVIEFEDDS